MIRLDEGGLMMHDLDHLVLPLLDIDTYESKIDNAKSVVVAFYVFEQEPAKDLERFIEHGDVEILDAETSPAPTEDGYYVVFIEMDRNADLPELMMKMVESINNLTDVDQWQFKVLHDDEIYDLTEENLRDHVNLDPDAVPPSEEDLQDEEEEAKSEETPEEEPESTAESIISIFKNGLMESIRLDGDQISLNSSGSQLRYKVVAHGTDEPSLPIIGLEIGNPLIGESARLSRMLGRSYGVEPIDGGLLVLGPNGHAILEILD